MEIHVLKACSLLFNAILCITSMNHLPSCSQTNQSGALWYLSIFSHVSIFGNDGSKIETVDGEFSNNGNDAILFLETQDTLQAFWRAAH